MDGGNMKYSIIIPIYNTERFLKRCIESCLSQTYKNIEVILVNDGSTDHSKEICERYERKDSRICLLDKKNEGVSKARNDAIKTATGDYIIFLDSDDYLENTACERVDEILSKQRLDILCCVAKEWNKRNTKMLDSSKVLYGKVVRGKEYIKNELKNNKWRAVIWVNVYRRGFLLEKKLFFESNVVHEDVEWLPHVFFNANTCLDTDILIYNYVKRKDSITTRRDYLDNYRSVNVYVPKFIKKLGELSDHELYALLLDEMCTIYLSVFYKAQITRKEKLKINLPLLRKMAQSKKNKWKVRLVSFSPRLYCCLNYMLKEKEKLIGIVWKR